MGYKNLLSQKNRSKVLTIIQEQGPINKAVIAEQAMLSIPTVMKITADFEQNRLVKTVGKGESTGGKRPDLLEFVSDAYYILGVDVGRRKVKAVLMDMGANIVAKNSIPVIEEHVCVPEVFVCDVAEQVNTLLRQSPIQRDKIMGIGVGMPGIIDHQSGHVRFSPDFNWEDVPLMELLRQHFSCPIMIENGNRTLALGEYTYGAGKGASHMFCINLGHGIGGAIVNHGEILHGASGSIGEFGHVVMDPKGPLCDCGNRGCLEALSSGNSIAKRAEAEIAAGKKTILTEISGKIEAKDVFDAAYKKDALSQEIVRDAIVTLGYAIASIINLIDPDVIVVAGGISKAWDYYEELLLKTVREHKMRYSGEKACSELNKLGDYGPAIGAATLLVQSFIKKGGRLTD